jgi:hypothetical protein
LVAAAIMLAAPAVSGAQSVTQPALRAAFLYNFAKFTEWPGSSPSAPLTLCVLDDGPVEDALNELVASSTVNGRAVAISRDVSGPRLRNCQILYVGDMTSGRTSAILEELRGAPVLTVSNGDDFVRNGGMVGLFVEDGRMRFIVNPDTAQRAGVRLSSKLLQLAKILKDNRQ